MGNSNLAGNALKGVALVVAATLAFAWADVLTKTLTAVYSISLVVALRYVVNLGLLTLLLGPSQGAGLWRVNRGGLVILRGLCLAAASLTMGLALRRMPVGETVAIVYLSPFAVMVLAGPLLGEKISPAGWIGAMVGFMGVLLIVRPGGGLDPMGVLFAVVNAGFATAYHLLTRVLARTETMTAMLFHTALIGSVIFCALAVAEAQPVLPDIKDTALMVLLGALATAGHFLFTAAYREAPASLLAPVNYLHLVWAAVLGWFVFGHMPAALSVLGMAMVVLAGAAVALRAHFSKRANLGVLPVKGA